MPAHHLEAAGICDYAIFSDFNTMGAVQDKRRQILKLQQGHPVGTALDEFAGSEKASKRIPAKAHVTFWFDGDKVSAEQTPEDLDLEDDMVLDVRW